MIDSIVRVIQRRNDKLGVRADAGPVPYLFPKVPFTLGDHSNIVLERGDLLAVYVNIRRALCN